MMLPLSTILDRYEHLMAMYECKVPIEEEWTEAHLLVAMQELNWVITGIVPCGIKREERIW